MKQRYPSPRMRLAAVMALLSMPAVAVQADDWPQWRGPSRDGVWRETGILESIPSSGLKVCWRARIGSGYSGPVVAQGRVFVTDHQYRPEVERTLCFEEATGKLLWVHSYPCDYQDMEYGNGPRASPTIHRGKVYTLGTKGHLFCLHAASGEVLWKKELAKDFQARIPRYGVSAAPLIEGDLLIVIAGGQPEADVIALDRNTGQQRWKALKDRPGYSAPIAITMGGSRQVIVWTAEAIVSLAPATGTVHWRVPRKSTFDDAEVVASPVFHKDLLLCVSAWSRGSKMLKLDGAKPTAKVLWETRSRPTTMIATPLFQDDGHFYTTEFGTLRCLDAASGKERWAMEGLIGGNGGTAHLTPNGDRVFLFDQKGHLILARLSPRGYQEISRCLLVEPTAGYRAQGPVTWAHPAYANRCVFARNDRDLVKASLATNQALASETAPPQPLTKVRVLADFTGRDAAQTVAFSPDAKTLAMGNWMGAVKILEASTGKELPAPSKHKYSVCAVAFSPDGKVLASAGGNEFQKKAEVKLWDVNAKAARGSLEGHSDKVLAAVFSPDNHTLATGSADQTVRLWDVATRKEKAVLRGHSDAVWSAAFSPDGKIIASASWDRTVKLWEEASGKERFALKGHEAQVLAVAIAPDGKTLASGSADWTVRIWDLATAKEHAVFNGHQGAINCLAFSSDGKILASGSGDETVKLWDVRTGKEKAALRGHRSGVVAVAFTPHDRTLASAGMDDPVRIWELPSENIEH